MPNKKFKLSKELNKKRSYEYSQAVVKKFKKHTYYCCLHCEKDICEIYMCNGFIIPIQLTEQAVNNTYIN